MAYIWNRIGNQAIELFSSINNLINYIKVKKIKKK